MEKRGYEKINSKNEGHIKFAKKINLDKEFKSYIGSLSIKLEELSNSFLLKKNNDYVGYISYSDIVDSIKGKTRSVYYAIQKEHRFKGYSTRMLLDVIDKLKDNTDLIVLNIDKRNIGSIKVATNCGFVLEYEDEDDYIFSYKTKN